MLSFMGNSLTRDILITALVIFGLYLLRFMIKLWLTGKGEEERYPKAIKPAFLSFLNWTTVYAILLFVLFYFSDTKWMFQQLFSIGSVEISLFLILIALFIITLANRLSKIFTSFLMPPLYDRYSLDTGLQFTFNRIFHYTLMVIAVVISLTTVGLDLSALTVFAGVLGVGIGFGMQNIANNFISGLIILFERPIKVGDRVIINDIIGDVEKINMRATIIRTLDNERIIMPNSYFIEEQVVNHSYGDSKLRLVVPIGVAYGSDVELVRTLLLTVADQEKEQSMYVLETPEPFVNFFGFGDSSLDFQLFIWISSPKAVVETKSNLNFRLNRIFEENGVEIPFPQRDLHVRSLDESIIEQLKNKSL
ncbi:mechanosensitive ion channel domain-containing protein [Pseudalkalibacillus hwajinpoensis]|uniref:mechanosensitive ion channel family protein n=1 Tax=Guptibacillus hwajinpoensis TaxID=208199 RepID=UPI00325B9845